MLSVSRAFGDFELKDYEKLPWDEQIVTCKPAIETFARSSRDNFLLLACDGIW
jgi:serine/threonine protein phosphatase PrpC